MDVDLLYKAIENPSLLNKDTLSGLKQLIEQYPYFQAARILYLKNLALLKDENFSAELKRMSMYISDRKKLFSFIESERGIQIAVKEEPKTDVNPFDLVDSFLDSQKEETRETGGRVSPPMIFNSSLSTDYLHWSISEDTSETEDEEEEKVSTPKLQHHDLIDSFIKEDEQRIPGSGIRLNDDEYDYPDEYIEEIQHENTSSLVTAGNDEEDDYFTETLARIYIKQKRYDKALQIIKRLSLKYPEKNVYFADQIRFLEKLITNNKK